MGLVAKAYTAPLSDATGVINVSDIIRGLDDIYDEFNGNIEIVNLASSLTFRSCNVFVSQTDNFYTGTTLEAILTEVVPRGYNSLHVYSYGGAPHVFPGIIEISGVLCRLNERVSLSGLTTLLTGGAPLSATVYSILVNQATVLTASDFRLTPEESTSPSLSFDILRNGIYYTDSATDERRVLAAVYNQSAGENFFPEQLYQKPNKGFKINLTQSEYYNMGFYSAADTLLNVRANFNFSTLKYDFDMKIRTPDGGNRVYFGCGSSWFNTANNEEFYVDRVNVNSGGGVGQNFFKTFLRDGTTTVIGKMRFHTSGVELTGRATLDHFVRVKRYPYRRGF